MSEPASKELNTQHSDSLQFVVTNKLKLAIDLDYIKVLHAFQACSHIIVLCLKLCPGRDRMINMYQLESF